MPFPQFSPRGPSPRRQRRDPVRVHDLRPQLELTHGSTQEKVRLVR
ncbi:hypothetical protein STXM2123_1009 [Streptomyces sp. F-3]|nr:hypothetical protein STXM2123_1009 [Streptomyces sp. F-3]